MIWFGERIGVRLRVLHQKILSSPCKHSPGLLFLSLQFTKISLDLQLGPKRWSKNVFKPWQVSKPHLSS
ncbi:MAG: hypothetical protein PWR02_771 [Synergistales bacterium]|nr:hypothetical protein [Synergistales bacterium]